MTEPERPTGGTHRGSSRADRVPVLVGSLIAIAVVAVAVVVVLHARGEPAQTSAPPAAASSTPPATSPAPAPSGKTFSPTGQASSPSSPTGGSTAATTPAPQTATSGQGGNPAPSAPLDVLNDSRITGLAHRAGDQFRAAGWDVALIGNFTGSPDVPETTIFFPDGGKAAAERLAARFGVDRVLPAPSFLSASHLSVVLARDWDEAR
jgi:hypothetical protein